jgi:predicted transposase/invertase (TIGR01784 family)
MARYMFEFYDELRRKQKLKFFNPSFCILIYNGDPKWYAPERFSELLYKSSIPKEYLPEFRYFKIAINEISRRDLVRLRNAVSAVFYVENNNPVEIKENWDELVTILKEVINRTWGVEIIQELINRIFQLYKIPENSKFITGIDSLVEVKEMLETRAREWEKEVFEKGIEKGIKKRNEQIALNMIKNKESDEKIALYTGLSINQIAEIREKVKNVSGGQEQQD